MLETLKSLTFLLKPLLITLVTEELVIFIFREKTKKVYLLCFLINIITNPSLNLILQCTSNYYVSLILLEVGVVAIEGLAYFLLTKKMGKALFLSLLCNLVSFMVGIYL